MGDFLQKLFSGLMAIVMLLSGGAGEASAPENAESGVPSAAATAAPTPEPTAEPTPEPTPEPLTKESAAALLEDFVRTKAYESDWQDNPYGADEYYAVYYAVVDLNGDDMPELLLSSNHGDTGYTCTTIYTVDADTHEIAMSEDGFIAAYDRPDFENGQGLLSVCSEYENRVEDNARFEKSRTIFKRFDGKKLSDVGELYFEFPDVGNGYYQAPDADRVSITREDRIAILEKFDAENAAGEKFSWQHVIDFELEPDSAFDPTDSLWISAETSTQTLAVYRFNTDGTLERFDMDASEYAESDSSTVHLQKRETMSYTWDGTFLEIVQSDRMGETRKTLVCVNETAPLDWDPNVMENYEFSGAKFLYQYDYVYNMQVPALLMIRWNPYAYEIAEN